MNHIVKRCLDAATKNGEANQEYFAKQIVGHTVLAIMCADTTETVCADAIKAKIVSDIVDSVREYWRFEDVKQI